MLKNRPSPMKTAKATIARAYRREEAVQLHFRDGLTLREAAERLGVSHETVWRDLMAAASLKDAETKQLAAWYRDKLVASHLEHMESVRATALASDFGAGGGSAAAGAIYIAHAKEVAKLTGAYLPEKVEVATDGNSGLMAAAQKGPATWALLQSMMAHGGGGEATATARVTANTPPQS